MSLLLLLASSPNGLLNDLVSYWPLNEESGNALDAHADLTLTHNNNPSATTGLVYATVRDFGGSGSGDHYFARSSEAALQMGDNDTTIAVWVRLDVTNTNQIIVSKLGDGSEYIIYYDSAAARFKFGISVTGADTYEATANNLGAPSTGVWYLIIGWHDAANNQLGICVNNGTPNTTAHSTGIYVGSGLFVVGAGWDGETHFWLANGRIGPVAMWKSASGEGGVLTPTQRTQLYNNGAGLVYSRFDTIPEGGQTYEESLTFGAAVASAFTNQLQAGSSLSLSTSAAMSDGNSLNGQSAALMSAQFSQAATTSALIEKTLAELSTLMAQTVAGGIAVDSSLSLSAQLGLSQAATALIEAAVDSLAAIMEQAQTGSGDLGTALALSAQLSVLAGGQLDVNSAFTLAAVLETIYTFGGSTDVALELAAVLALSGSGQIQVGDNLLLQCALQLAQMSLGDLQANTNLDLALSVSNYGAQVVGAILQLGNLLDVQIGGGLSVDVLLALAAQMAVTPTSTLTLLALLSTLSAQFGLTSTTALEAVASLPLPVLPSLSAQSAGILGAAVTLPFVVSLNFNGAQGNITYEAELQLGPLLSLSTVSSAILPSSFDLLVNLQIEQTAALQTVVELQIPLRLSLTGDSTLDAQTVVQLSLQLAQTAATQAILGSTTDLDAGLGLTVAGGQMLFAALAQSIRLGLLPTSTSFAMDAVTPACRRLVVAIETRLLQVEAELRNIVVPAENRTITVEEELRIAVVAPESRVIIAVC